MLLRLLQLAWLQVRHLSMRLLACATELAKHTANHAADNMKNGDAVPCFSQLLSDLSQRLRSHLDDCPADDYPKQVGHRLHTKPCFMDK